MGIEKMRCFTIGLGWIFCFCVCFFSFPHIKFWPFFSTAFDTAKHTFISCQNDAWSLGVLIEVDVCE